MRNKLTFANVMSTIAVFLALSGGAYALTVTGRHVVDESLTGRDLANRSIGVRHLKAGLADSVVGGTRTIRQGPAIDTTDRQITVAAKCNTGEVAVTGGFNLGNSQTNAAPTVAGMVPTTEAFILTFVNVAGQGAMRGQTFVVCVEE
jgi:hypothetical protein